LKLTHQELNEFLKRNPSLRVEGEGMRSHTIIQEQQTDLPQQKNKKAICSYKQKKQAMDGANHKKFRVSIHWLISDRRTRDGWGMAETIADCVVSASRRFLGLDDSRTTKRRVRKQG